ncbi:cytolytic toxin-alpha-like, partial [Micropterus dolomieu]|uniref:cytolytic toxin-alpha-like n=1 Tax=Micropterus dolomieu TaxID=147949 RepID=UPI001E8EDB2D
MAGVTEVAALGRPFTLGMLYDARKDQLIPGLTLWDDETLKKNTVETCQQSSDFKMSTSDSIESKASLLDVDSSLKASFLSGLITVGGSAKYLNDTKKFKNQSRVTCQYKATTRFKQLTVIDHLTMSTQQTDGIKKGSATHVVTGILYGANAVFVFDSEKLHDESVQNFKGKMKTVINKIPKFNVDGKVDIKLNDEEKALTEKFSCKFYGDFILESNPATFEEAVKTYIQLPKLLEKKGENSVPLKVWLMPLKKLAPKAPVLVREISVGLVRKAENALEDLNQLEKRCNGLLEDKVVRDFPQIHEKFRSFQKWCGHYAFDLRQTMEKKIPSIRNGKEDERKLEKVFKDRDNSPFSHAKLTRWMDFKESEINIIRSCVEKMEGTKFVPNQSELDREVLGVEEALCFVLTSLQSADPCLDAMTKYLKSSKLESTNEESWFYSDEVITNMREKAKYFQDLTKPLKNNSRFCFLIAAIENKKYTGATIYHYRKGKLVSEGFSKPPLPPVEKITGRRDLLWCLTLWDDETLKKNTVETCQQSSDFKMSTSDSIESKASLLDVDSSLKASFLSGLITVGGSAKYLNDTKKFKNQSRVTCQYKATTRFKQLTVIDHLTMSTQQTDGIKKGSATHVVTGILYGANAVFVFDSEKLHDESVQNFKGKMKTVINKIPKFNVDGKVDIKLNDEEKALTEKFSCKFYGDFILESNPATFEEAVKTYIQLPKLLEKKGENSVPLKVWLMPLKKLAPKAPVLVREISVGLVRKAENALEDLNQLEKRCNGLLEDKVVRDFPQIHEKFRSFQKWCGHYAFDLRQTMEKKIPSIRNGKEDERKLEKVFKDRDNSPFSHAKLTRWMDFKESEINIIRSCVEKMEGTKFVPNQSELDREVLGVEEALCFVLTSLQSADPCLDAMTKYLKSSKLESTNEESWFYSDEVITNMREKAKYFQDLTKPLKNNSRFCFLIAAIENKKYTGATIYHYRKGKLVSEGFSKPPLPPVEKITGRRDLLW